MHFLCGTRVYVFFLSTTLLLQGHLTSTDKQIRFVDSDTVRRLHNMLAIKSITIVNFDYGMSADKCPFYLAFEMERGRVI